MFVAKQSAISLDALTVPLLLNVQSVIVFPHYLLTKNCAFKIAWHWSKTAIHVFLMILAMPASLDLHFQII